MTWLEFKQLMDAKGVQDADQITYIDTSPGTWGADAITVHRQVWPDCVEVHVNDFGDE